MIKTKKIIFFALIQCQIIWQKLDNFISKSDLTLCPSLLFSFEKFQIQILSYPGGNRLKYRHIIRRPSYFLTFEYQTHSIKLEKKVWSGLGTLRKL